MFHNRAPMTEKRYDRAYFDHWYRGRSRVSTKDDVRRKVSLAVAECEYFLRRRLRSVLDVACGEGAWQPHIKALRPGAKYLGLDPSDYAVVAFRRVAQSSQGVVRRAADDAAARTVRSRRLLRRASLHR